MKHLSTLLILLPVFALACGSEPATHSDEVSSARASLALGDGEEQTVSEDHTVTEEASEEPRLALVAADAGAPTAPEAEQPEAQEPPVVGDAGAPPVTEEPATEETPVVAPEPEPQSEEPQAEPQPEPVPPPACDEGATQCVGGRYNQACVDGAWTSTNTCDFACNGAGGCRGCYPGEVYCDQQSVWVCGDDRQMRVWVRPEALTGTVHCEGYPEVSSLPIESNPPRWLLPE